MVRFQGLEVKMENTSLEEIIAGSLYCLDLDPMYDPYLMKMIELSTEPKEFQTIEAVDITKSGPSHILPPNC